MHQIEKKALFVIGNYEANTKFFNESHTICHTFSRTVYEEILKHLTLKKKSILYNDVGNLGSCSLPWILYKTYGKHIPKG